MFSFNNTTRQASVIVAMLLIPCLALAYFIFYENIRTKIEDEKKKNIELAKVTAQYLDTYIRSIKCTLQGFNHQEKALAGNLGDNKEIMDTLGNSKRSYDAESYFILNRQGQEVAVFPQSTAAVKVPGEFLQKAAVQGTIIELLNRGKDPVKVVIISPILGQQKRISGFAGAVISMEKVARDFANIKVSNNGYVIMIDRIGQVLVHPNSSLLRKRIPVEKMKHDPIFQDSSRGIPGAIEIVAPYDGKKKLFSYAPVRETGWIVLLVEPETDLQVLVTTNLTRNSIVFLLAIISVFSLYQYLKLVLQRASQEADLRAEKLALVAQLAAGMAHEIRNPLTSLKGFLQMSTVSETNQRKKEHQAIMLSEIDRIEEIITKTLLLAKPQKQKVVKFSLSSLVQQIVPILSPEATRRNIELNVKIVTEALTVSGDPNHTKQALINIVKNAVEASPDGETVTIEAFGRGSEAIIQVTDKGSGIAVEVMGKVGTPFFTTKTTGVGLGLMVTNRVVESMGGKLEISSKLGQGTTAVISFPLA